MSGMDFMGWWALVLAGCLLSGLTASVCALLICGAVDLYRKTFGGGK